MQPIGFGRGSWGQTPWGGFVPAHGVPSGEDFDVYCFGPGASMEALLDQPSVVFDGDPVQVSTDDVFGDLRLVSGGRAPATEALVSINENTPATFTYEVTVTWTSLPPDFGDVVHRHVFVGMASASACTVGLCFSRVGIGYVGSGHLTAGGDFVLDTALQVLPGSQDLVSEGRVWVVRVAVSYETRTTYVYVTAEEDVPVYGHRLRYVLPAILSSSAAVVPPTAGRVALRGTASQPSSLALRTFCLGTGLRMPNIPPVADPGLDQSVVLCSIAQLDGSKSHDPEGASLVYHWRLIEAPPTSGYAFSGADGRTYPLSPATGFANRLYADSLGALHAIDPVVPDDVLVVGGTPHRLVAVGSDELGFFAQVATYDLPDDLPAQSRFEFVRQRGLSGQGTVKPTFYPDVAGFYRFDLVVFDGGLYSLPADVVVNVVESPVARGVTPDVRFLWDYLSDFWRLVEGKERIEVFWSALAQVAAAELLTLWQLEYNKSLRDVQRLFARKWLHYDLALVLASDDAPAVSGWQPSLRSAEVPQGGATGLGGTHLDIALDGYAAPLRIAFVGSGAIALEAVAAQVRQAALGAQVALQAEVVRTRAGTAGLVRLRYGAGLRVLSATTCPLFRAGQTNGLLQGTAGYALSTTLYVVEQSLTGLGIGPGDVLVVDGEGYRIARVVDDPSDPWVEQRVVLLDALPAAPGGAWAIGGRAASGEVDFHAALVTEGDTAEVVVEQGPGVSATVLVPVLGAVGSSPGRLALDTRPLGLYLAAPGTYQLVLRRVVRHRYVPLDPLVRDVPLLQATIVLTDPGQALRRNLDFFLETFRGQPCVRFVTGGDEDVWEGQTPPARLWAEVTMLDNRPAIEDNFGRAVDFTLDQAAAFPSNIDYLSAVRGLWYAYFTGPTLFALRAGTQILLGLPYAEEAGVIEEIRQDFSSTQGRILLRDAANPTLVRSYVYPSSLPLETNPATGAPYAPGDAVEVFAPLVGGVEVLDYIKKPDWFHGYVQQGRFFEVEKFMKFLVRVDASAFQLSAFLFVQSFIRRIRPTYTFPMFVVRGDVGASEVTVTTVLTGRGRLRVYASACDTGGVASMFDQPNPAGGGWMSQFDYGPGHNEALLPVWAFDRELLCPQDVILGTMRATLDEQLPAYDSVFSFDHPLYTAAAYRFVSGRVQQVPGDGLLVGGAQAAGANVTLTALDLEITVTGAGAPGNFVFELLVNGTVTYQVVIALGAESFAASYELEEPVVVGDGLACRLRPVSGGLTPVLFENVQVVFGAAVRWALDALFPAGTYFVYRDL